VDLLLAKADLAGLVRLELGFMAAEAGVVRRVLLILQAAVVVRGQIIMLKQVLGQMPLLVADQYFLGMEALDQMVALQV
jgi:hypothetical protein